MKEDVKREEEMTQSLNMYQKDYTDVYTDTVSEDIPKAWESLVE